MKRELSLSRNCLKGYLSLLRHCLKRDFSLCGHRGNTRKRETATAREGGRDRVCVRERPCHKREDKSPRLQIEHVLYMNIYTYIFMHE